MSKYALIYSGYSVLWGRDVRLFFPVNYLLRASRSVLKHGILKVYIWKHVHFTLSKWGDNSWKRNFNNMATLISASIKSSSNFSEAPRML